MNLLSRCGLLFLILLAFSAKAQSDSDGPSVFGENVKYEIGFHMGNVLPNGIDEVTEITTLSGLRGGWRTSKRTVFELGAMTGSEEGASFSNAYFGWRLEQHIEMLVTHISIGLDTTILESASGVKTNAAGMHLGAGFSNLIAEELWFRGDMKYNFNPGTSLYIGIGFTLRYGSDDSGGGQQ